MGDRELLTVQRAEHFRNRDNLTRDFICGHLYGLLSTSEVR
jgi:hypothetical protein